MNPESPRLTFGLVAAPDESKAAAAFDALAKWVAAEAEVTLERVPAPTYEALATSVREGKSDLAWLPPVVFARIAEGVTALGSIVRAGRTSYAAALVVSEESKVVTMADLQGLRAGWVDPWSAAGFVVPRIELAALGLDPATTFRSEKFYGSHREVLHAMARGECDVAGTFARSPDGSGEMATEGAWTEEDHKVRVIATFGPIPTDVIAVRRNLAPEDFERALAALRKASEASSAHDLVRAVFGGDKLQEGVEPGHETLRRAYERAVANDLFD
ncbi:MAG: hypothetical protein JWM98_3028 [Thermoleophilia bacterium]|nr:hypothetical protein [Thermoleophilia bacterium]